MDILAQEVEVTALELKLWLSIFFLKIIHSGLWYQQLEWIASSEWITILWSYLCQETRRRKFNDEKYATKYMFISKERVIADS